MYISNPNRKKRASNTQPNSNPDRMSTPNVSDNRFQSYPLQAQQPQAQNSQFRTQQPQAVNPQFQDQQPQALNPQFQDQQLQAPNPQLQNQQPQALNPQFQDQQLQAPNPQLQNQQPQAVNPQTQSPRPQAPGYENTGIGGIIVRVTTASGAIPLEDALVTISEYRTGSGGDIVAALKTNSSGLTEKVSLPTPSRSMSLSPGNGKSYSSYVIQVEKEGYNTQQYINVPVFDGVTAVQSADLVPLPENGETDRADPYNSGIFYESEAPRLDQSQNN